MSQFIEMFYGGKYTVDKLRKHIDVIRGVSYKPSDVYETHNENTSIVLRSNNIEGGQINFDDLVYVSTDRVSEFQLLSAGDIVMCGSNGSKKLVGKAAMLQSTPIAHTSFGAFCLGIRCKPTLVPEYLATYFQTSLYRDKIEQLGSGSNILNIKPDHIYNLEIPIPLYDEQMAFVTIVKQADKSEFVGCKSQFIEMFGDTHMRSDHSRQWKEVVEIINGKDYKSIQVEDGGYPVYGTGGEMARASDYLSPANSILLGRKGTIDKPLLIREKYWNVDTAFGAVPDEKVLHYVYFYWHCKTIDFNVLNKGTTLPSTTKVDLLNLWIKIPSMEEQTRFGSIVEQADKSEYYN